MYLKTFTKCLFQSLLAKLGIYSLNSSVWLSVLCADMTLCPCVLILCVNDQIGIVLGTHVKSASLTCMCSLRIN